MSVRRLSHGLDLHSTNPCFISYSQSQAFFSSRTLMLSISEIMLVTSHSLVESLKFWFRSGAILWCWQSWPPKKPSKSPGSESQNRKILSSTVRTIPGARQRTTKRTRRSTEEASRRKDFRNFFFLVLVLVEECQRIPLVTSSIVDTLAMICLCHFNQYKFLSNLLLVLLFIHY